MESSFAVPVIYVLLGALGFFVFEVSVRIIDYQTGWIKKVGIYLYLTYLVIYGLGVSIVAGGFSYSVVAKESLAQPVAVMLGIGLPSTIRFFSELMTKAVFDRILQFIKTSNLMGGDKQISKNEETHSTENDRTVDDSTLKTRDAVTEEKKEVFKVEEYPTLKTNKTRAPSKIVLLLGLANRQRS